MSRKYWLADAAIAAGVTGIELVWAYAGQRWWHGHHDSGPGAFGIVILVIGGLALTARRRYPAGVLAVTLAATFGAVALGVWTAWLALIVAIGSAVRARRRAAAEAAAAVRHSELEERLRRASEERLAMARDLHDVVAHNISVINVQANTALHLMDRQPERARQALTAIHEVSRQALGELGSVLGVLRRSAAPLAPAPGLDGLGELAARACSAGIAVDITIEGTRRELPAGVGLAAYRIVQEALTNTVRHSGGTAATVRLKYEPEAMEIEVTDDGAGGSAAHGGGNGVAGMTERALALGGTLAAGPRPGGGFGVLARLPA